MTKTPITTYRVGTVHERGGDDAARADRRGRHDGRDRRPKAIAASAIW